nr:uncharacterized protein LOC106677385 [Halyomorpha halys]
MDLICRSQKLSIILFLLVIANAYEAKKQQDKFIPMEMSHWNPGAHAVKRGTIPQHQVMVPVQPRSEGASLTVNVFGQPKFFVFMGKKNRMPIPQHRYSHPPIYEEEGDSQSQEPVYSDEKEYQKIKGA